MVQIVKNLPAMWETWVQSLGKEDPLEKEMATPSSILAWRIPWTEEPWGLSLFVFFFGNRIFVYQYIGEGTCDPLQYSCLENPMDGGAL